MNSFILTKLVTIFMVIILPSLQSAVINSDVQNNEINKRTARSDEGNWNIAGKFMKQCMDKEYSEMPSCFGIKTVAILDRASRMNHINILPGLSLVANDMSDKRDARALLTEEEIENSLPSDPSQKSSKITDLLFDSVSRFLQDYSLQFRLPKSSPAELSKALDEGRGKLKKKFLPILGLIAVKIFALLPLLLGVLGFLALKALVVGKIALIIAAILAIQKYSSGGSLGGLGKLTDGWNSPSPVSGWNSGASSPTGYYRRSIENDLAAQKLAYSAHDPTVTSNSS